MLVTYDTPEDAKLTAIPLRWLAAQTVWNTATQRSTLSQRQQRKSTINAG